MLEVEIKRYLTVTKYIIIQGLFEQSSKVWNCPQSQAIYDVDRNLSPSAIFITIEAYSIFMIIHNSTRFFQYIESHEAPFNKVQNTINRLPLAINCL